MFGLYSLTWRSRNCHRPARLSGASGRVSYRQANFGIQVDQNRRTFPSPENSPQSSHSAELFPFAFMSRTDIALPNQSRIQFARRRYACREEHGDDERPTHAMDRRCDRWRYAAKRRTGRRAAASLDAPRFECLYYPHTLDATLRGPVRACPISREPAMTVRCRRLRARGTHPKRGRRRAGPAALRYQGAPHPRWARLRAASRRAG
jgi:hypothetical protein